MFKIFKRIVIALEQNNITQQQIANDINVIKIFVTQIHKMTREDFDIKYKVMDLLKVKGENNNVNL